MKIRRLLGTLAACALLAVFAALPAHGEEYTAVLEGLTRLQTLAEEYAAAENPAADPVQLTLSYTRGGSYNTTIWSMVAPRSQEFVDYVDAQDASLTSLIGLGSVETPGGSIDFGHLLASMDLVTRGLPITGSWGGDCMELARQYQGQASDAAGYAGLMAGCFDGNDSMFGGDDLRADLDSVVIGAPDSKTRFAGAGEMFDYIFANYTSRAVLSDEVLPQPCEVVGGRKELISVRPARAAHLFCAADDTDAVDCVIELPPARAPIAAGDVLGRAVIYKNGVEADSVPLLANEDAARRGYFDSLRDLAQNWNY